MRISIEGFIPFHRSQPGLMNKLEKKFSNILMQNMLTRSFLLPVPHGINMVASGLTGKLNQEDEIIVSEMEHHSNIVPWQMLCEKTGATLRVLPMNEDGTLNMAAYESLLSDSTKLV